MSQILAKLSDAQWVNPWVESLSKNLGEGFTADADGGLFISPSVTEEEIGRAVQYLVGGAKRTIQMQRIIDRFIGNIIVELANRKQLDWTEAIEELRLEQIDGRKMGTFTKLAQMVTRLDAETLMIPDLSSSHFQAATSLEDPMDADKKALWKEKVKEVLIDASLDPVNRSSRWVHQQLAQVQFDMGLRKTKPSSKDVLLANLGQTAIVLRSWLDDDYRKAGREKNVVVDYFEHYSAEALKRGLIKYPSDPETFKFPWEMDKVVDAQPTKEDAP